MNNQTDTRKGYVLGLIAYGVWGMFPLYFKSLDSVAPMEVVTQRIIWSALFGALLLLVWHHPGWLRDLFVYPRRFLALVITGTLIATNWLTYVWAVHNDQMVEASLGYYINPLVNVLLAMLFLRERLRRTQWFALGLAAIGVLIQVVQLGKVPWIALILAMTFGLYGLIRKQAPVAALPGLVMESWILVPAALAWLWLTPDVLASQPEYWWSGEMWWLALAGPLTLLPLLAFNGAAKRLPYTSIAFLQYLTPTMLLLFAVLYFGEAFTASTALSFAFIWAGLVVYSLDAVRILRRSR